MEFLIGRQAILDRKGSTFGYELLYREASSESAPENTDGRATHRVIINAFLNIGIDRIASEGKLFINFTRDLLTERLFEALPPERVVVEVLEDVPADKEVTEALKEARKMGFMIALDDFSFSNQLEELVKLADIVKIDFLNMSREKVIHDIKIYRNYSSIKLLAEKIETREEYEFALKAGFSYFQGFYFQKPLIESKRDLAPYQMSIIKALRVANNPDADINELVELISGDLYLHTKLLAFINSPVWGLKRRIKNVSEGVKLLGIQKTREWLNILLLAKLSEKKPKELVVLSTVRAKFLSLIAERISIDSENAYLLGMHSLMDAILQKPMGEILKEINYLDEEVKDALLGKKNRYHEALELIKMIEKGEFDRVYEKIQHSDLSSQEILNNYMKAIEYADRIYQVKDN